MLRGTAIVDIGGKSKLIEAPQLIPAHTKGGDITFQVEFSTDAKFMCNKFVFEGNALHGENEPKRISLAELEVKQIPNSISTITSLASFQAPEPKPQKARSDRRFSFPALEIASSPDSDPIKGNTTRRSTILV